MVSIAAEGKVFEVAQGSNLRESLLEQNVNLYSATAKVFNCRGLGICGTCLTHVEGVASDPTPAEIKRLSFPPHLAHPERRLSCQVKVLGDLRITRFEGYFGEGEQSLWAPEQGLMESAAIASSPQGLTVESAVEGDESTLQTSILCDTSIRQN